LPFGKLTAAHQRAISVTVPSSFVYFSTRWA
jgi:hypothetical protein